MIFQKQLKLNENFYYFDFTYLLYMVHILYFRIIQDWFCLHHIKIKLIVFVRPFFKLNVILNKFV